MLLRPPLSASFISSYDIRFDAELSHIVHSPIAQVDRPVIRALPKYHNRASVDNAFNILAVSLPWIWTAANPSGVSPCRRETCVTWEYTREYTCAITYRSPLNVAIENATRINIYRSKGYRITELQTTTEWRKLAGDLWKRNRGFRNHRHGFHADKSRGCVFSHWRILCRRDFNGFWRTVRQLYTRKTTAPGINSLSAG